MTMPAGGKGKGPRRSCALLVSSRCSPRLIERLLRQRCPQCVRLAPHILLHRRAAELRVFAIRRGIPPVAPQPGLPSAACMGGMGGGGATKRDIDPIGEAAVGSACP